MYLRVLRSQVQLPNPEFVDGRVARDTRCCMVDDVVAHLQR